MLNLSYGKAMESVGAKEKHRAKKRRGRRQGGAQAANTNVAAATAGQNLTKNLTRE